MLLLVLLVVQTALWVHGDQIAASVAQRTTSAARAVGAAPEDARGRGQALAADLGGNVLGDPRVEVERGAATVRVAVSGSVPSLIPGLTWPVRRELTAPVERFVPPPGADAPDGEAAP